MSKHNLFIINHLWGGYCPIRRSSISLIVLLLCTSLCSCGRAKSSSADPSSEDAPVVVSSSIFWNRDSLNYYAAVAYKDDDPKGQFVTGAAYYLQREGDMPADFYTVSREEADSFLMLSAGQDYQPAKDLIRCLQQHNQWNH